MNQWIKRSDREPPIQTAEDKEWIEILAFDGKVYIEKWCDFRQEWGGEFTYWMPMIDGPVIDEEE